MLSRVPIRDMFEALVPEYDRFNRFSSLGMDIRWRREAASLFDKGNLVLDVGTGTGDLAKALLNHGCRVVGVDFSERMINSARKKYGREQGVRFEVASADHLPFEANTFDGLTSAFVLRNLHRGTVLPGALQEFHRVLKPGARMVHVELTMPPRGFMKRGHDAYLRFVLPAIGRALFRSRWPKDYLTSTIKSFYTPEEMCEQMRRSGFEPVSHYPLCHGIAGIFIGIKC